MRNPSNALNTRHCSFPFFCTFRQHLRHFRPFKSCRCGIHSVQLHHILTSSTTRSSLRTSPRANVVQLQSSSGLPSPASLRAGHISKCKAFTNEHTRRTSPSSSLSRNLKASLHPLHPHPPVLGKCPNNPHHPTKMWIPSSNTYFKVM